MKVVIETIFSTVFSWSIIKGMSVLLEIDYVEYLAFVALLIATYSLRKKELYK